MMLKSTVLKIKTEEQFGAIFAGSTSLEQLSASKNIYVAKEHKDPKFGDWTTGVTVEKATASLVTGCPHCNYSYCE